ncbi:MAG: FemAB family protein [Microgenomates group bacterium GW2011_GWC1_39_7b]|uniref:FemAB family protein n=3 Tax=Candidatus Woeseibacteriota TaxID=1752722 RepID=A0A0G0LM86_9BACT|nr:MAG: FemAB family protein [Candidatus Woesebacteria bacterium GW2011_GWB1_39_10]KKR26506.1 MAG: FemAB family protein [Microgenomates group bacterium GW2011_GWC1_39_7b]KKR74314.1 MAG: FemAB family protein [Candidatus Woesebacteria bacterium GW2011_GWA2_40_7]KKS91087.1 MAG: FemAB family protein [Candidatus Woesebacteria bacterium GW2011_GWA1_43_12]
MTTNSLDKIATHPLQTSAWADFRRKWGNEVLETKWGLLTVHRLPFTDYKLAIFEKGPTPTRDMLNALCRMGKEQKLIFIKLESNCLKSDKLAKLLQSFGAVPGKTVFTPTTFWIDLIPSEENLMKGFSSKTRYNIRLAIKNGVTVKENNRDQAFERYLELTRETVNRQGFYAHTEKYHQLMWKILRKAGIAHLLTATYQKQIITTWILFVWKDFLYYPYGASTEEHKNVMANNLMMWEAIKFGKKLGLKTFDLWGREEGKGFTKFKEGYNPHVVEFFGTWDLVINKPMYLIYKIGEWIRWPSLKLAAKFGLPKHRF